MNQRVQIVTPSLEEAWSQVQVCLKSEVGQEKFDAWFGRVKLEVTGESNPVVLSVPTYFHAHWIRQHFESLLQSIFADALKRRVRLQIRVRQPVGVRQTVASTKISYPLPLPLAEKPKVTVVKPDQTKPKLFFPAGVVAMVLDKDGIPVGIPAATSEVVALVFPSGRVTVEGVQRLVAGYYEKSVRDLVSVRRTRDIVRPRQVGMYLAKTKTPQSLPQIGRKFGGRDHTTVLHAVNKITRLLPIDVGLATEIEILSHRITQHLKKAKMVAVDA